MENIKIPKNFVLVEGNGEDIKDLYVCKYPVTQREYEDIMKYNPSKFQGNPNNPVEMVSWYDAVMYCNELSKKEKLNPMYDITVITKNGNSINRAIVKDITGNGYRVLTDEEWRYVAKGGKKTNGYLYSGSNNINEVAWHSENSDRKTQPVGRKKANELGIYDMSGNVWEWNRSELGDERYYRGGSWYYGDYRSETGSSEYGNAGNSYMDIGFRVCRNVS